MARFTTEEIEKIAHLARLELSSKETEQLADQLTAVLQSFADLQSIDTTGVEPMTTPVQMPSTLREDDFRHRQHLEEILNAAKERAGNLYSVPPVV